MSNTTYNPKIRMMIGWSYPLILAWLLTLEISWLSTAIAVWLWLAIVTQAICAPLLYTWAYGEIPSSVMTEKNKAIANIPLPMYVVGFVATSIMYGVTYEYYPITAVVGWSVHLIFLIGLTRVMQLVRERVKLNNG